MRRLMTELRSVKRVFGDFVVVRTCTYINLGFGGLVVSILASGTRVRGFKHGQVVI